MSKRILVCIAHDGKKCPCVRHKDIGVSGVLAPFVHNLSTRWRWEFSLRPGRLLFFGVGVGVGGPEPTEKAAGGLSTGMDVCRWDKFLAPAGSRTAITLLPSLYLGTIATTLCRLPQVGRKVHNYFNKVMWERPTRCTLFLNNLFQLSYPRYVSNK